MFEGFLDHGVKQSEGQFFTPVPDLPLYPDEPAAEYHGVRQHPRRPSPSTTPAERATSSPSWRFSLSLSSQNSILSSEANRRVPRRIYGVEKEYRLSKVAKVSAFM